MFLRFHAVGLQYAHDFGFRILRCLPAHELVCQKQNQKSKSKAIFLPVSIECRTKTMILYQNFGQVQKSEAAPFEYQEISTKRIFRRGQQVKISLIIDLIWYDSTPSGWRKHIIARIGYEPRHQEPAPTIWTLAPLLLYFTVTSSPNE